MLSENYVFKCAYIYNEESFLRGNKAKIIIQPKLFINSIEANFRALEEISVTAIVTNELSIPNTYSFKNCQFTHKQELELEIPSIFSILYLLVSH